MTRPRPSAHRGFDQRIFRLVLLSGGIPTAIVAILLLGGDFSPKATWTALGAAATGWLLFAFLARERVVQTLQTVSSLLSALREGDFSLRARGAARGDPLSDVHAEVNLLADILQGNRQSALDATALLRKVIEEVDIALLAVDGAGKVRLCNPAAVRLLGEPEERVRGRLAAELGLAACLEGPAERTLDAQFGGARGRWGLKRAEFRERGEPMQLLVLDDLNQVLRQDEAAAWQRLVRVIGHELNNSLAPIKSLAGSLLRLSRNPRRAPDWEDDLRGGLEIIESRSDSLSRFMSAYARLARLPKPTRALTPVAPLLQRCAALDSRVPVTLQPGPEIDANIDAAQVEQVVINLLKNAAEAVAESGSEGGVRLGWTAARGRLEVTVEDDGPGIANSGNLFVPFFTTKEKGSGIGLVLCRQIAENHGGTLGLENRDGARGAVARLSLPL